MKKGLSSNKPKHNVHKAYSEQDLVQRKTEHVEICATKAVEALSTNGIETVKLPFTTLPSVAYDEIDLSTKLFGRIFSLPIYIPGMTGGMKEGARINQNLAAIASELQIPMGVGSQRVMAGDVASEIQVKARETFELKRKYSNLFLIGNIGMGQLSGKPGVDVVLECAERIDADAMAVHCNALQEIVQKEGDRNFCNFLENLEILKTKIQIPLLIKEVGTGMDAGSLQKLKRAGLDQRDCIDIGGHGGTNWAWIEGLRGDERSKRLAHIFREVGVSTLSSIENFHEVFSNLIQKPGLIATGGMRTGLDIAKALYRGADSCGVGLPLFKAALVSEEAVMQEIAMLQEELCATFFACDAENLPTLQQKNNVITQEES